MNVQSYPPEAISTSAPTVRFPRPEPDPRPKRRLSQPPWRSFPANEAAREPREPLSFWNTIARQQAAKRAHAEAIREKANEANDELVSVYGGGGTFCGFRM